MRWLRVLTWPPLAATILACAAQPFLADRYRMVPVAVVWGSALVGIAAALASYVARERGSSRVERLLSLVVVLLLSGLTINVIVNLMELLRGKALLAHPLLSTAIGLWLSNVISFSLWYWYIDGHGRGTPQAPDPDWIFPVSPREASDPPERNYFDYLFLAFNTATAFSPTDVEPVTTRARMLMMIESAISLGTIAIVAARAVNMSV
jgi:hypothetical protein